MEGRVEDFWKKLSIFFGEMEFCLYICIDKIANSDFIRSECRVPLTRG